MRYGKMEKKESRLTGKAKFVESRQCLRVGRVCEEEGHRMAWGRELAKREGLSQGKDR